MSTYGCVPLVIAVLIAVPAAEGQEADGFRAALFNGENLDGWHVTGCEAAVADRLLVLQSGNGLVRTDHEYGDFVLELDWRAEKDADWDSGIFFRAALPEKGRPWPTRYQVNLLAGQEGNVKGLEGAQSTGLVKPGQWNHFKLKVVGSQAELEINGQPAWKASGVEPASGYLGLQAEVDKGGRFQFKNLVVTELRHRSLFNGRDLSGWSGGGGEASACWKVADGLLECTGEKGPWLRSQREHGDFNLRLQYRLKTGGNSGVFVRVPEDGAHQGREMAGGGPSGVEVQILDDASGRYREIQPYQFAGSIYAIAPAEHHVSRLPGRWNTLEIDCRGTHYRIVHNGVVLVDADAERFPELANRELSGFLGLQNHSEQVWFRDLRVATSDAN
ncbi:MAG: DUF1080 domain-containing protein [Pirellulales bacterium]